jgi:hypothetical protein
MTSVQRILPIAGAALLGGWVAFATLRNSPTVTEESSPPALPSGATVGGRSTAPLRSSPAETDRAEPQVTPAASAPPAPSESPPSPQGRKPATLTTPDEQLRAEVDCDRKKLPEACEEVALALETGSAGTHDAARASKLRRIALTLYVKQCETDRAFACTRLAEMHDVGEVVQKDPRNAAALRARVIELCRLRPNQIGCQPP